MEVQIDKSGQQVWQLREKALPLPPQWD